MTTLSLVTLEVLRLLSWYLGISIGPQWMRTYESMLAAAKYATGLKHLDMQGTESICLWRYRHGPGKV
jgi:hypothetical protein